MSSTEQVTEDIWRRIKSASKIDELDAVLREIGQREVSGELDSTDALTLAHSALESAADFSREDVRAAWPLMRDFLIPLCVRPQVETSVPSKIASSNLRNLLADWIDQCPAPHRHRLRSDILDTLCRLTVDAPTREAIGTIGVIGYRDEQILRSLWRIAERTGQLGDSAVNTLAGLGLAGKARERLIGLFCEKVRTGIRVGLLYALQQLAGPELLDMLLANVSDPVLTSNLPNDVPFLLLIRILSKIADHAPADRALQDRVWQAIRVHKREAMSSPDVAGRCDTPATLIDYARWVMESATSGAPIEMRDILYERLGELVRPRQLAGWDDLPRDELLPILRKDACHNTNLTGEFITTGVRLKVDAIETALALGCSEPDSWLDEAVGQESNPHVQQMVLNVAASLKVERLPACVLDLVRNEFNASSDAVGELVARAAAIRLAHSAGTRQAFELLLESGLTLDGSVLISTADALADLAVARVEAGDPDVAIRLLDRALDGPAERHRDMAVNALCFLAIRKKLDPALAVRLIEVLEVQDLKENIRSKGIEALGFLPANDFGPVDVYLVRLTEVEGNIGFRAIEAIIRRGHQNKLDERVFRDRIGVKMSGDIWSFPDDDKISGWQAFLVGLLYRDDSSRLAPAVADVLRRSRSDAVFRLFPSVIHHGLNTPPIIADALVGRIYERFRRNFVETSLFDVLAKVAPNRLVLESWAKVWDSWLPEGRGALCDAIRTNSFLSHDARAIAMLSALGFDSTFAVRRAAFRALAAVDADALESSCRYWADSDNVEIRQRAAEAAAWLPSETVNDDEIEEIGLATDRERSVRNIAEEILPARRKRDWATQFLDRILSVRSGENQNVLPAYRFGRALEKLGDDDARRRLTEHIANAELPPNVVHWLNGICKGIDDRWKQETRKWPQPWLASEGHIEELDGRIVLDNAVTHRARFSLWCRWATGPSEFTEWGAVIYPTNIEHWSALFKPGYVQIVIPGRAPARAVVAEQGVSSNPARQVLVVHGTGPYPDALEADKD
jgi:hypothetical protein